MPVGQPWNAPTFLRHLKNMDENMGDEVIRRSRRAREIFLDHAKKITEGPRTGKWYYLRERGLYQASAPGEPFTVKTGKMHEQFETDAKITAGPYSWEAGRLVDVEIKLINHRSETWLDGDLIELLEAGTRNMAPRPTRTRIIRSAWPYIMAEFNRSYFPKAAGR